MPVTKAKVGGMLCRSSSRVAFIVILGQAWDLGCCARPAKTEMPRHARTDKVVATGEAVRNSHL
jgi:hypothetical protein